MRGWAGGGASSRPWRWTVAVCNPLVPCTTRAARTWFGMRYAILSLLALTAAACTDQPTAPRHTGSFRVLPTISLIAGQRADITPSPQDRYDSLLTASSSAITFLGMDTVTFFLPEGPGPQEQIYHLRADTSG